MEYLKDLNAEQLAAVKSNSQFQLVLAGAGSGKTRVLVNKIAWLMQEYSLSPYQILALTFTNKAAKNMRVQLEKILQQNLSGIWMGTFHGIAHRILRRHAEEVGLDTNFQVIDQKEQIQVLKSIYKNNNISEKNWPVNKTAYVIQKYKSAALRADKVTINNPSDETYIEFYKQYEQLCINSHLVDFTELLLKTYEILNENSSIQAIYHEQFHHVCIDEFQDTSQLQFQLMQAIAGKNSGIIAVGDDDQSIYSWRGASVEHMHNFSNDKCEITKLEQNYRSSSIILESANNLISNNSNRLGKNLWCENKNSQPIKQFAAFNDLDEANYIASEISNLIASGTTLSEIAVLYRSNAQSRVIEEQLNRSGIPYKIYGGLRFFDRMEIKDILAYLSLCVSNKNDAAFERIINKPARGIGNSTLNILRSEAYSNSCSLFEAMNSGLLSSRAKKALSEFKLLIERLSNDIKGMELKDAVDHIAHKSGLIALYEQDEPYTANSRLENIQELMHAAGLYSETEGNVIASFISEISLEPIEAEEYSEQVQLMTVHSAKGLEFNSVFITGLEEGLFPHQMSVQENNIEEERRLCYVAITRARENLHISYAQSRRLNGKILSMRKSRFIGEMTSNFPSESESMHKFSLGQKVFHKKFGEGVVLNTRGAHEIQVAFSENGEKWILGEYLFS